MKVNQIKLKLYLEGVEVPIISVQLQEQLGQPPVAMINLPAKARFARIWPRTAVHLFYKMRMPDQDLDKFYLIFEGEVSKLDFSRRQSNRGITITCNGLTGNWRQTWKAKVDFSLDTLAMGQFLMIGNADTGQAYVDDRFDLRRVNDQGEAVNSNWVMSNYPATTITHRFKQNFQTLMNSAADNESALENTFKDLILSLAVSNPYYYLTHVNYKIDSRIKVLNNSTILQTLKGETFIELLLQKFKTFDAKMTGTELIQYLLNKIEYQYNEPSAPSWDGEKPVSIFFTPDLDFSMPLRCNTIYPDQVVQSGYSQDFLAEPTRMVAITPPISLIRSGVGKSYALRPRFITPQNTLYEDSRGLPTLGMSKEEIIRGINPQLMQYNDAQFAYTSFHRQYYTLDDNGAIIQEPQTENTFVEDLKNNELGNYVRSVVNFEFLKRRYGSRTFTVSTPYVPTRLVGFPGMVIDKELPTVVGKIVNISSSISATGEAMSTVVFSNPRMYFDQDVESISDDFDPFSGDLNDLTDNWPDTPFWLSKDNFTHDKIGEVVMPLIYNSDTTKTSGTINAHSKSTLSGFTSRDNTTIALSSIQQLRKKYNVYEKDKHLFIDKETERSLVEETSFWNFLLGVDKPEEASYRNLEDIEFTPSAAQVADKFNDEAILSPFIQERKDQIIRALEELQ